MTSSEQTPRRLKVARLVQKEIGNHLQREAFTLCKGRMVSVTNVRMTPDLAIARVYLSIFPSDNADEVLNNIKLHIKSIRHFLGLQVHQQLRIVPDLEFFIDDSLDYVAKIDNLLKKS
ncbi:MAG TPA: 30S ribosome-binding factor RbfA [Bacteroidales bacterium]